MSFAFELLQHFSGIQVVSKLLRLNWHVTNEIMHRAVNRGLSRRSANEIAHIGLDEKSFRSGHQYITTLNDLHEDRVLDVDPYGQGSRRAYRNVDGVPT